MRDVKKEDYPEILRLNEADVELLSPIDMETLSLMNDISELFKVIEVDSRIVGFLLVFNGDSSYWSENFQWFKQKYSNFLYIDRIVIDKDYRKYGFGIEFYQMVYEYGLKNDFSCICAEIDIKPVYNEASMKFHQKMGYKEVGQKLFKKTITVSLQIKEL